MPFEDAALTVPGACDGHPLRGSLLAVGEAGGEDGAPGRSLEVASGEKWLEAVWIEISAVAGEGDVAWLERSADEAGEIPLDGAEAGVFEVGPEETFIALEDIFLWASPWRG